MYGIFCEVIDMLRATALVIEGFKNVEYGRLELSSWADGACHGADIVGIYGQNGSGKTSVVYAIAILRDIMLQGHLSVFASECIGKNADSTAITMELIEADDETQEPKRFIRYRVAIGRAGSSGEAVILAETLACKDYGAQKSLRTLFSHTVESPVSSTLKPAQVWNAVQVLDKSAATDILVACRKAQRGGSSVLFSEDFGMALAELSDQSAVAESRSLGKVTRQALNELIALHGIVDCMRRFSVFDLAVVPPSRQAGPMVNLLSISTHEGRLGATAEAHIRVDLEKPSVLPSEDLARLQSTIGMISSVLERMVPGLSLGVTLLGSELDAAGNVLERFEVTATRGVTTVPLRCESEGIKKLIGILVLLIDVYAKPGSCVVIDELDSGLFEYLLGEILDILQEYGKGQLIFTAHNLRPLEVIAKSSLVFTTTNPKRRYIKFRGSKATNNLRDQYLRAINIGGQPETIYDPTSKYEIDAALYEASQAQNPGE